MNVMLEESVPIPAGRPGRYAFGNMALGESFWLDRGQEHNLRSAASSYALRHPGLRFTVARVIEKGELRVRCWRIK